MAIVDPGLLTSPIAGDDPCGPDLDATGDAGFMNFFAFAPFQLPDSFFEEGRPFDPNDANFRERTPQIPAMLTDLVRRSHDLRVLVFLARFAILKRSLDEFVDVIAAIRSLLDSYWEGVHPRASDGSFEARVTALEELNDSLVTFSLQFVTLHSDRRRGNIAYRSLALALDAQKPAADSEEKEKLSGGRIAALNEAQIAQALGDAGEEAVAPVRAAFQKLAAALLEIRALFAARTGGAEAPNFDRLSKVVNGVQALFDAAFPGEATAGPSEAADDADGGASTAPGAISSAAQARRALESAKDYFGRFEPSSPALPLVAQALELQGKTFVEVLAVLAPDSHAYARYSIGDQQFFRLAVAPLGAMTEAKAEYFEERPSRARKPASRRLREPPRHPIETSAPTAANFSGDAPGADESGTNAEISNAFVATSGPVDEAAASPFAAFESDPPAATAVFDETSVDDDEPFSSEPPAFPAETRAQTLFLLKDVASYFRAAEPSSPIPWLIDRARVLAEKDFLAVLDAVFERDAFLSSS